MLLVRYDEGLGGTAGHLRLIGSSSHATILTGDDRKRAVSVAFPGHEPRSK
jgi:hypothetical protein